MVLTKSDRDYLGALVQKELEHFSSEQKTLFIDVPLQFLKGEHDYRHFLEALLKKLD
jgi:hypothetical protein